jgi:hypothetical protein
MAAAGSLHLVMSTALLVVLVCVLVAALEAPFHQRGRRTSEDRGSQERGPVDPRKHVPPSI